MTFELPKFLPNEEVNEYLKSRVGGPYYLMSITNNVAIVQVPEEWKKIPGFPKYMASNRGRIKNIKTERILKQQTSSPDGRCRVNLRRHGEEHTSPKLVHRLVAMAFLGEAPKGRNLALHKDGNYLNNIPENLYWGNQFENAQDKIRHGRSNKGMSMKGRRKKITDEAIKEIWKMWNSGMNKTAICREIKISYMTVLRIINKTYKNYVLKEESDEGLAV
ncbi:NUMOD4 domain-containing protein [Fundidesulfovibrio putealis]|uniref:NUMOD4 domain-containing protein n=1 Tax=Fundidesulfovibrio putealis TaxID=270496 RepID=UPI00146F9B48|nr:NUMOD4 domain-containing protein [Fundidesulfovibrio putealis]